MIATLRGSLAEISFKTLLLAIYKTIGQEFCLVWQTYNILHFVIEYGVCDTNHVNVKTEDAESHLALDCIAF